MHEFPRQRIAVCLACHNRKESTLLCLSHLLETGLPVGFELKVYLLDDGSSDGTADAISVKFPDVAVFKGNGNLYWGGGMRIALSKAIADNPDFYLWLNDDVMLLPGAICGALETFAKVSRGGEDPCIVVSALRDKGGHLTYSGMKRQGFNPLSFRKVEPHASRPISCDTMNGNFVLIPARVINAIGNIDSHFTQQIGDIDYGLRARKVGIGIWLAPGFAGVCAPNSNVPIWRNAKYTFLQRWRNVRSPLGAPFRDWLIYGARHGGVFGVFAALAQYRWLLFPNHHD